MKIKAYSVISQDPITQKKVPNVKEYTLPPQEENKTATWLKARLKRHLSEMTRLALPVMATRLGIMGLGLIDTAVVGNYATNHLAWLNMANQTVIMVIFVGALGLLMGVQVEVAKAFGAGQKELCGQVWRRTMPLTCGISLAVILLCYPADIWLGLLGIEGQMNKEATSLIRIMVYGLPFHMFFAQSTMFLEAIGRARVSVWVMVIANIVNLVADIILVYGVFISDPLGAEGAAWASTIVRLTMASVIMGYIWFAPSMKPYGARQKVTQKWRSWSTQRRIGYASSISLIAEVAAFSALVIFAGWISNVTVAAHGVTYSILGVPLMLCVGIGVATSVRVGIAYGRSDMDDARLAGYIGLLFGLFVTGLLGALTLVFTTSVTQLFTDDVRVINMMVPVALIFVAGMIVDGLQMIASGALRGLGETWWPTGLQIFAFNGVMLPACYYFGIVENLGFKGLMMGMAAGCFTSLLVLVVRFHLISRSPD